jgi:hypothetical protein
MFSEESKADVPYNFFDEVMDIPVVRSNSINLNQLDLPCLNLAELGTLFTEEVWNVVRAPPPDKTSGVRWVTCHLMMVFDAF